MSEIGNICSPWAHGPLPGNVHVGPGTRLQGELVFKRFRSREPDAIVIGAHCTLDGVHLAVERAGRVRIGDYCYLTNALLLCEHSIELGSYVMMGWNSCIADSDFHPLEPAQRIADAIACSPLGEGRSRPPITPRPVTIGDHVYIGPNVTILKGVRIGEGALLEPGSLVTRDVPPRARVLGNPAQIVGEMA